MSRIKALCITAPLTVHFKQCMYGMELFEKIDCMYRSHNHPKDICLNFVPQTLSNFIFYL